MTDPCTTCLERDLCKGYGGSCRRKEAYMKWKSKAKEIGDHIHEVMRRAKDGKMQDLR